MRRTFQLAAGLIALLGCGNSRVASAQASESPPRKGSGTSLKGTRTEYIPDPTLGMNAIEIKVPAKWHFQGVLFQGGSCVPIPFGVYRSTSPDGLSFVEQMPVLGWAWGTGFAAKVKHDDCVPLKKALGAQDFLKYVAAMLKVEYVADEPVPPELSAKAQKFLKDAQAAVGPNYAAMHTRPPIQSRQLARAIVRFQNGSFTMKGRLQTLVDCTEVEHPGMKSILRGMADQPAWVSDQCTAQVKYIAAPEGEFAAVAARFDEPEMEGRGLPDWQQAWMQRSNQQAMKMMKQMSDDAMARQRASAQQFAHDQAVRQHMHEEFLSTMQRGTDLSMARTTQNMNARSTATSDWVDYALDRQTVRDPGTGQVSKVSNASSYTWVDSSGKTSFQTNDVNADPNGVLQGTWTKQQVVHGDGSR